MNCLITLHTEGQEEYFAIQVTEKEVRVIAASGDSKGNPIRSRSCLIKRYLRRISHFVPCKGKHFLPSAVVQENYWKMLYCNLLLQRQRLESSSA